MTAPPLGVELPARRGQSCCRDVRCQPAALNLAVLCRCHSRRLRVQGVSRAFVYVVLPKGADRAANLLRPLTHQWYLCSKLRAAIQQSRAFEPGSVEQLQRFAAAVNSNAHGKTPSCTHANTHPCRCRRRTCTQRPHLIQALRRRHACCRQPVRCMSPAGRRGRIGWRQRGPGLWHVPRPQHAQPLVRPQLLLRLPRCARLVLLWRQRCASHLNQSCQPRATCSMVWEPAM